MVQQRELNLNEPLDANTEPQIRRISLDPSLATAALTLHGDYYRQLQSKCNGRIVRHPVTQIYIWSILVGAVVYQYRELIEISDSVGEFLYLASKNKFILASLFPVLIFLAGTVGIVSFLITDEFRAISDQLSKDYYMEKVFRFPLRIYANASEADLKEGESSEFYQTASRSTDFIEYRNSPIAVVTVIPLPDRSTEDTFYAKITGLHVRKSYRKGGVESDLLEFAKEKAADLGKKYVSDNKIAAKNIKVVLVAEAYTVDDKLPELLAFSGFKVVGSSYNVNPFTDEKKASKLFNRLPVSVLMSFLGFARVTYELELDVATDTTKATETKKAATGSSRKRK